MSNPAFRVTKKIVLVSAATALAYKALERMNRINFKGKLVLITGGGSGLGFALARQFLGHGAKVIVCGRKEHKLKIATQRLENEGELYYFPCDIRSANEVASLVGSVMRRHGIIDILINNAGIIHVGPQESMNDSDFCDTMNTNFWGTYYMCRQWLPYLRPGARIVNITSIGGVIPVPRMLPYTVSKFAAYGFSEGLRTEVNDLGIKVTTVVPGLMRTGSHVNAIYHAHVENEFKWFSFGAGLPGISMAVEKAAASILHGVRFGKARVYLGWNTPVAHWIYMAMPGFTTKAMNLANLLIESKASGKTMQSAKGSQLNRPTVLGVPFLEESLREARADYQPASY